MNILSRHNPLTHYQWGASCEGWTLVDELSLSIKLEKMPGHTSEQKHFHQIARQFFFILQGEAVFEIAGERVRVGSGEGIHIDAGKAHRILNETNADLEFILTSQPSSAG